MKLNQITGVNTVVDLFVNQQPRLQLYGLNKTNKYN